MRGRPSGYNALVHGHARPGDPLHEEHGSIAIEIGAMPAILLDDAEHASRSRMAGRASRDATMRDRLPVRIKCEPLAIERDEDAEHALRLRGDALGTLLGVLAGLFARSRRTRRMRTRRTRRTRLITPGGIG